MKIVDKTAKYETEFCNINVGDVFYNPATGGIYMRTEDDFDEYGELIVNAVNLKFGSLCAFTPCHKVIPLNCECVITNK